MEVVEILPCSQKCRKTGKTEKYIKMNKRMDGRNHFYMNSIFISITNCCENLTITTINDD